MTTEKGADTETNSTGWCLIHIVVIIVLGSGALVTQWILPTDRGADVK